MDQAYLERNRKGFEGDEFIAKQIEQIVKDFGIDWIVETGTFHGWTTKRLAEFAPVTSCEVNPQFHELAKMNLAEEKKVALHLASSPAFLRLLPGSEELMSKNRVLFFLDAHWGAVCPLLDELWCIAQMERPNKPVIVIHDFKVPDRPELGFDTYNGQDLEWNYIAPSIDAIYGAGNYVVKYNTEAEGAMRGVVYITPAS